MKNMAILCGGGSKVLVGVNVEGAFTEHLHLIAKKHESKGNVMCNGDDVIILNSFDGADVIKSKDNLSSVMSFSSQMFTPSQIQEKKVRSGSSFNVFTWLQVIGKESIAALKIVGVD